MNEAGKPEGLPGSQVKQPSDKNIAISEEKEKPPVNPVRVTAQPGLRMKGLCVLVPPWEQGPMKIYPHQEKSARMLGCLLSEIKKSPR
jgi:hypothetical protein